MHQYRQVATTDAYNFLVGYVHCIPSSAGTIIVAAYSKNQDTYDIADYSILHQPGPYELMVPKGCYHVLAFRDDNNNFVFEKGEPAGQCMRKVAFLVQVEKIILNPDIVISTGMETDQDCPFGLALSIDKPQKLHNSLSGDIVDLEDGIFAEKYGTNGYWAPMEFLKELGANIYFLEEYDPEKIPILFIHGATGSPRGWRYFIEHIDRTRFQPWLYYYPSGASMKSMSDLLFWKLLILKNKYHFENLVITAHSMGGLVARSFIMDYGKIFPSLRLFISISTPWGGDKLAGFGVKQSPVVIPSWKDLQPEGAFLNTIYRDDMSVSIDFYIFFGHKGNRNPLRSNNDGIISLASLLDLRPQAEAKKIFGFNEDHDSILSSKEVLLKYNAILDTMKAKSKSDHLAFMENSLQACLVDQCCQSFPP